MGAIQAGNDIFVSDPPAQKLISIDAREVKFPLTMVYFLNKRTQIFIPVQESKSDLFPHCVTAGSDGGAESHTDPLRRGSVCTFHLSQDL